jgi:hypothetical protein
MKIITNFIRNSTPVHKATAVFAFTQGITSNDTKENNGDVLNSNHNGLCKYYSAKVGILFDRKNDLAKIFFR